MSRVLSLEEARTERFCRETWQRHQAHGRPGRAEDLEAMRSWFRSHWPLLATALIVAHWKIEATKAESTVAELDEDLVNPKPPPRRDPREVYGEELRGNPAIAISLADDITPIGRVFDRAHLTKREREVAWKRLTGDSWGEISSDLGMRVGTATNLWGRARDRMRLLANIVEAAG